jgi:hypothetical protein
MPQPKPDPILKRILPCSGFNFAFTVCNRSHVCHDPGIVVPAIPFHPVLGLRDVGTAFGTSEFV